MSWGADGLDNIFKKKYLEMGVDFPDTGWGVLFPEEL